MSSFNTTSIGQRRVRVLCAPASFKESIAARAAAEAMVRGIREADQSIEADSCPIADGGEGSLETLVHARAGEERRATVAGPLGEPVEARFGLARGADSSGAGSGGLGIVELAEASGLVLVAPKRRDPTRTTTYGTGELIRLAAERGCEEIIVCIGGSATVDGGAGLAQALGARFFDAMGRAIDEPLTGGSLHRIAGVEPVRGLPRIRVACDVDNPLCGPHGAAAVYGPQKGATPEQVGLLDDGLANLARVIGADPGTRGFGAAGGAAMSLVTLCGASMERGIELILDAVRFDDRCRSTLLVLTGEGRLDAQSLRGKAVGGVAEAAKRLGVPTIAIVGSVAEGWERCLESSPGGFLREVICLSDRFGRSRAMAEVAALIESVASELARSLNASR